MRELHVRVGAEEAPELGVVDPAVHVNQAAAGIVQGEAFVAGVVIAADALAEAGEDVVGPGDGEAAGGAAPDGLALAKRGVAAPLRHRAVGIGDDVHRAEVVVMHRVQGVALAGIAVAGVDGDQAVAGVDMVFVNFL